MFRDEAAGASKLIEKHKTGEERGAVSIDYENEKELREKNSPSETGEDNGRK